MQIKYQNIYKFSYSKQISASELLRIKKLLVANLQFVDSEISQNNILLANRSNFKSPWSEKARQIISNCGFDDNLKIDHLRLYSISSNKILLKIKSDPSILCDKMTQLMFTKRESIIDYLYKNIAKKKSSKLRHIPLNSIYKYNKS